MLHQLSIRGQGASADGPGKGAKRTLFIGRSGQGNANKGGDFGSKY
jgi:hypothetical protein